MKLTINAKHTPCLDEAYVPAVLWNQAYQDKVNEIGGENFTIALERRDGTVSVEKTQVLPHNEDSQNLNLTYIERLIKFLLWQKGGYKIYLAGNADLIAQIKSIYSPDGERAFDFNFMGEKVYGAKMEIHEVSASDIPASKESAIALGRNLDGCRIGFDLGGSDRKCAAVKDGEVVFSEEIPWDPYFESNPSYHIDGINDTLKRAAEKLPRVDAIGGSSAGVYVNNEVRAASLFRGVSESDFDNHVKKIFFDLKEQWDNVPFEVVNDGEVTALAGSMSLNDNGVLGISMGTSLAAGYVDPDGHITPWLNELAFAPIDYRENAPVDEWSGDHGCGVQYFSQQGVARLIPAAGIDVPEDMPFPEQLVEVQNLMKQGDDRARKIYETIGVCFGYTIALYAKYYDIRHLLILGRVTSGDGGQIIIDKAQEVLKDEFPELAESINLTTPDEANKRHGQAVAAASLPAIA